MPPLTKNMHEELASLTPILLVLLYSHFIYLSLLGLHSVRRKESLWSMDPLHVLGQWDYGFQLYQSNPSGNYER